MSECKDMQNGRLDPAKLDAVAKPKRRRRKRKRPAPPEELRDWEKGAERRVLARAVPPGIMLEPAGFDDEHWTAPHNDPGLWTLQLADAFGTRSRAVISTFLAQLEALCGKSHWDEEAMQWRLDENQFSAALAIVASVRPRNEAEACLAAQMVAIHLLTMKVTARAIKYEYDTRTAAVAAKLARTYAMQLETLRAGRKRRTTARQSIKVTKEVHQHVHYHRGEGENDRQPHEREAETFDQCAALPSSKPGRQPLPMPSRKGKAKVQAARRL